MSGNGATAEVTDIAVVGLACRFAGAPSPEAYWERIEGGEEQLTVLAREQLQAAGIAGELLDDPSFIPVTSLIEDATDFDPGFFGIMPSEAELMDPQHRLFLELTWGALEDAGYDPSRYPGDVGVFAGGGRHAYLRNVEPNLDEIEHLDGSIRGLQADIGNYGDFLATRCSFRMGLRGPSMNVQTACSTALVAVHLACQSLFLGEADIAIAGGVSVHTPQESGYVYEEGSICSPDGHLRPFDARANGSVFGNGGGAVALKRLRDAIADGDSIRAVIKGTAVNNDGDAKMSFTAPSVEGQAKVVARALQVAGVDPSGIGFVESHGTGTPLGDPIEIAALIEAFGQGEVEEPFCALGAVKAQIGHLGPAAGIAGLIKATLVLEHGWIPPCVNFETLNPGIALAGSPFYIPRQGEAWEGPRLAGVSAFGVGGTNAHAVLQQAPVRQPLERAPLRGAPIVLSARSEAALATMRSQLADHLEANPELDVGDVAWVLASGRKRFRHRVSVAADSAADAATRLAALDRGAKPVSSESELPVVFAFPGQGAQYVGMGRALYEGDEVFRATVERGGELLASAGEADVRTALYPAAGEEEAAAELLRRSDWAQPAIFVCEYALARSLLARGVCPEAMIGHSLGEYAAACIAGVLSFEDALRLTALRGRLMHGTAAGGMLAVGLDEPELRALMPATLDLAAVNAPGQCVVSGPTPALAALEQQLESAGTLHKRLGTFHAAHSSLMDPILEEFGAAVAAVELGAPTLPIASTVTGAWVEPETMADPGYWVRHLRQTVRFMDGLETLRGRGAAVLAELGPGRALAGMHRQLAADEIAAAVSPWLPGGWEAGSVGELAGRLWEAGAEIDWERHFGARGHRRVSLPGYPFERRHFWVQRPAPATPPASPDNGAEQPGWLQVPRWAPTALPAAVSPPERRRRMLLLGAADAEPLTAALRAAGHEPLSAAPGLELDRLLAAEGETIDTVLWASPVAAAEATLEQRVEAVAAGGFWTLLDAIAPLARRRGADPLDLLVLSEGRHLLSVDETSRPELALLDGPCRVLPQEYPNLRVGAVDFALGEPLEAATIAAELDHLVAGAIVAHRHGSRYTLRHEAAAGAVERAPWKPGGRYLISGGLGAIGLALAADAASAGDLQLVLVQRTVLPEPAGWEALAADPDADPELRFAVASLLALRARGTRVDCVAADVTDRAALARLREQWGPFDGIVHAAGLPGGRLIDALDRAQVERVLAPKVRGALLLDEVVAGEETEWMLLCSSMSAVLGGVGHVDYCAANAFLDAFAAWRSARGRMTISLDFDAWSEGGMAVREAQRASEERRRPLEHPLFDAELGLEDAVEYHGVLREGADWVVDEHRLAGEPLLPGTAMIELLRAAAECRLGTGSVEIAELDLLQPLAVPAGAVVDFAVGLKGSGPTLAATIESSRGGAQPCRHATALVRALAAEPASARFDPAEAAGPGGIADASSALALGPRWQNLRRLERRGEDELVVGCELDPDFHADLERFGLHPALLDIAAGALVGAVAEGVHLPMSYERIAIHSRLPSRVDSRIVRDRSANHGSLRFDVRVQDEHGLPLIEIDGYALRAVEAERVAATAAGASANRSLACVRPGELDALAFVAAERVPPGPGEVEIEVLATGLNFKEILIAAGMLDGAAEHRFGLECAGVVRATGPGVDRFAPGDLVMAIGSSCFSDLVTVSAGLTQAVPAGVSAERAATIPVAFTTAYDCLVNVARLQRGERVLVHAAAGGVGLAAVQIARHLGAEVFGTAGNPTKREFVAELGASRMFDSRSLEFEQEALAAGGVDVVLNSLSGEQIAAGLRTLRPRGRFVEIGRRDILAGTPLDLGLFDGERSFSAYNPDVGSAVFRAAWAAVARMFEQEELAPLPLRSFAVDEAAEAFAFMSRAHHIGKVVVARAGAKERLGEGARATAAEDGITAEIGTRAVRGALSLGEPQVLVTRRALESPSEQLIVAEHVLEGGGAAGQSRPDLGYDCVPLEGECEQRLGEIWSSLLGIEEVGAEDRFLDLGGDSLCATQVVARIRTELGVRVAPADLLGELTLRDLAAQVEGGVAV